MNEVDIRTCLQKEATNSGTSWDYILKLYALEGIIRRLSLHLQAGELVVRGSLITRAWVQPHYRPVDDIDFLADYARDAKRGLSFINEILAYDLQDFITYQVNAISVVPTWVDTPLPGERLFVPTTVFGQNLTLQIDLAYDDPLVPSSVQRTYPMLIPVWKAPIYTIRPELACAWKVHGLFEFWGRRSTAWEMKDLYDIYLISQAFPFDKAHFSEALRMAFSHRKTPLSVYKRVLEGTFGQSKGTEKAWGRFYAKRDGRVIVANHKELLEKVRFFLDDYFLDFLREE